MPSPRLDRALARLDALVNWERRDRDASMRTGLEPITGLLALLGDPQLRFRAVHVTGTKGKGTTSALIEAGLRRAGLRTGLYASPHVVRIHERIRIDGREVEDEVLAFALERALDAREQALGAPARAPGARGEESGMDTEAREAGEDVRDPRKRPSTASAADESTWFDLLTATSFLVFAEAGVEWAVIEVGLGGRLDSTNVVHGEVCVITNIDLEHTRVLGPTRAHIAHEKAGILKRGATLVTGVQPASTRKDKHEEGEFGMKGEAGEDPADVIDAAAARLSVPIVRPAPFSPALSMLERNVVLARLVLDELGKRGVRTRAGASAAAGERAREDASNRAGTGPPVSSALLDAPTISSARLPARAERRRVGRTPIVIDAAHVASSVRLLLDELSRERELSSPPVVILALGRDKDAGAILKELRGRADRLLCTTVASGPLVVAETLAEEARAQGLAAETAPDPARALARGLDLTRDSGWLLVVGSFYLAGAVRERTSPDPHAERS